MWQIGRVPAVRVGGFKAITKIYYETFDPVNYYSRGRVGVWSNRWTSLFYTIYNIFVPRILCTRSFCSLIGNT